jgi:ubiquinone biosynthesis monooxygenase Coq7
MCSNTLLMSALPAPAAARDYSPVDRLIGSIDQALRTVLGGNSAARPYPAEGIAETVERPEERRHAAALMRVNHSGEVAAQALYQGQAAVAASQTTHSALAEAAREETDHLAWCSTRIHELGGRTSLLNPLWYAGSFAIGALAATFGDRVSLGFVSETERQVEGHLDDQLTQLPAGDSRSRSILEAMRTDEIAHGASAKAAGGADLPAPVRVLMKHTARVMTGTAYWI